MYLLAIDTATNSGGVALSRNEEVVGLIMVKTPLEYSDHLIEMVDFVLSRNGITLGEVGGIGVSSGPGSFTGVRIGLATAKALGQALNIPAVGISSLEALADQFRHVRSRVSPMIDARRQQIYGAVYDTSGAKPRQVIPESVMAPTAWVRDLPREDLLFVGDGARMYRGTIEALRPDALVLGSDNRILDSICRLSYARFRAGESAPVDQLAANYVRPPDAEPPTRARS